MSRRYIDISGGEFWDGDDHINDYSIHIDDVTFSDIEGEDLAELVVKAYNHLDLNGHRFRMVPTSDQDQEEILTYRGTT
jgi:hypothetical protein